MPSLTKGYFHCLECGALFKAAVVSPDKQCCPVCDKPPTGRQLASSSRLPTSEFVDTQSKRSEPIKHVKRKEKKSKAVIVMLVAWLLLMGLTVGLVKYFSEETGTGVDIAEADAREKLQQEADRRQAEQLVKNAAKECELVVAQFLNATSAEAKAQFVYEGRKLATEMSRYYRNNPSFSVTRSQVKMITGELLRGTPNQTISAFCVNEQQETFEVIFIRSRGEWKIDWKALVRHDDRSWALFPAGSDGDEGEFRLYMRVRDSNKELNAGVLNLVFYKPEIYLKEKFSSVPSPTVSVPSDSEAGRIILALVNAEDEDQKYDAYGSRTGTIDPAGYHRVFVKIKLHKEGSETRLELLDIMETHWYGSGVVDAADSPEGE